MICPECKDEGRKSRVTVGGSSSTLMCAAPFYDEEGRYHYHDPNTTTTELSCSNGHRWAESHQGKCWCGE